MLVLLGKLINLFRNRNSRMNPIVYRYGTHVFLTHSIPSTAIESWVRAIAKDSGQLVDWHWIGGRASICYVGNRDRVLNSIVKLRNQHDTAFALNNVPAYTSQGIWEYNEVANTIP